MIDFGKVHFFWSEVWRSFTRNVAMQITAIGTVAVMTVMLGSFLFARQALTQVGDRVVRQFEISVFLSDGVDAKSEDAIRARLAHDPLVRHVAFVSKAEGLKDLQRRVNGQIDTSLLTENPLPDTLRVRVVKPDDVDRVAARIKAMRGVANVEYAQDVVRRTLQVIDVIGRIGIGLLVVLVVTSAIIISSTIRLTVFARRREIAIMRLVGASSAYVRGPFIVEGLLSGALGAGLAVVLLALAEHDLLARLTAALPFVPINTHAIDNVHLALFLLGVGVATGIVASWISVGRYLRA